MTKYLIDTNVFIDFQRGNRQAYPYLVSLVGRAKVASVTYGELLQGVRTKKELQQTNQIISLYELCWTERLIEEVALKLVSDFVFQTRMGYVDAVIAALALTQNLILITKNSKHFSQIPELSVMLPEYESRDGSESDDSESRYSQSAHREE